MNKKSILLSLFTDALNTLHGANSPVCHLDIKWVNCTFFLVFLWVIESPAVNSNWKVQVQYEEENWRHSKYITKLSKSKWYGSGTKIRHINWWNRWESPEISSCTTVYWSSEGYQGHMMRKGWFLQQTVLAKLDIHYKKDKTGPLNHHIQKSTQNT